MVSKQSNVARIQVDRIFRYFREIEKDPLKYVYTGPESRAWLVAARQKGLKLFLATNSFAEYVFSARFGEAYLLSGTRTC